jgi:tetratricopeptide (TPR) repeat protein
MKNFVLAFVLIGTVVSTPAYAQTNSGANEVQSADVPDEVIATARKQTDPAMSAFLSGDYATAEIEFDKNAFCALRVERNFRSGVEGARDASIRADLAGNIDTPQQTTGGPGAGAGAGAAATGGPSAVTINGVNSLDFQKNNKRRTCEDRGFQVYMKGLSQLELGKTAEAKKTLSQATKIHRTLYDAHFKLSLLEYQEGNLDKAQKELRKLRKIAARCKRCDAKPEIEGQVKYLDKLLSQ